MSKSGTFLIAVLGLIGLSGCLVDRPAIAQGKFEREERTMTVDGHERDYLVLTPVNAKGKLPVVFGLHGGYGTGEIFEESSKLHQARGAENFIFVYPSGFRRSWNAGFCCAQARSNNIDDVKFFRMMMDKLAQQPNVDGSHFFVTGFSNGAMMTYRLACDLSERITAVAPVGGGSGKRFSDCTPARAVPLMHIHGSRDEWAPFAGGTGMREQAGEQPSIEEGIRFWSKKDGCSDSKKVDYLEGANCTAYSSCNRNVEVTLCKVEGMAHQWPGDDPPARSVRNFGTPAPNVRGSDAILTFFRKHMNN